MSTSLVESSDLIGNALENFAIDVNRREIRELKALREFARVKKLEWNSPPARHA